MENNNTSLKRLIKLTKSIVYIYTALFLAYFSTRLYSFVLSATLSIPYIIKSIFMLIFLYLLFKIVSSILALLNSFSKKDAFIEENAFTLMNISIYLSILAVFDSIFNSAINPIQIIKIGEYGLSLGNSTAVITFLSLFSLIFSLILLQAIEIKEDNDLTI